MGSRVAFSLLQVILGNHYHFQLTEQSDRQKVILDHLSDHLSCSEPSMMQQLKLRKISSEKSLVQLQIMYLNIILKSRI